MRPSDLAWLFSSSIDASRKEALESAGDFESVIERILSEATVVSFNVCRGNVGYLTSCYRPEFELSVHAETADLFFNSPNGYRAAYLRDHNDGQMQNSRLLQALTPKLLSFALANPAKNQMPDAQLLLALQGLSAKVWLPEGSFKFNHELIEEIVVPLWHRNALAALEAFKHRKRPEPEQQEKAIWGLRATRANALQVKGAFLDSGFQEVVPQDKILRRFEIQQYGYA